MADDTPKLDPSEQNATIGVYASHHDALAAIKALRDAGLDQDHVSVVGKGVHEEHKIHGYLQRGTQAGHYGGWGALWGALTGWLLLGFMWLPGIGWVAAGGWLAATILGGAFGAGLGALVGLGVPKEEIPQYEDELKANRYLVVVHGTAADVQRADGVLRASQAARVGSYAAAA